MASIHIGTGFDLTGFNKGYDRVVKGLKDIENNANTAIKSLSGVFNKVDNMSKASVSSLEKQTKAVKALSESEIEKAKAAKAEADFEKAFSKELALEKKANAKAEAEFQKEFVKELERETKEKESQLRLTEEQLNLEKVIEETISRRQSPEESIELTSVEKMFNSLRELRLESENAGTAIKEAFKPQTYEYTEEDVAEQREIFKDLTIKIRETYTELERLKSLKVDESQLAPLNANLEDLKQQLDEVKETAADMGYVFNESTSKSEHSIRNIESEVEQLSESLSESKKESEEMGRALPKAFKDTNQEAGALNRVLVLIGKTTQNSMNNVGKSIKGVMSKAITSIKDTSKSTNGLAASIDKTLNRIKSLLVSTLVFNVLRSAFKDFRDYLGQALNANQQFVNSFAQLKGNLLTAFQPIMEVVVPILATFISWLSQATAYLAAFISMLIGKSVQASAAAAKAMNDLGKATTKTGKETKKAEKEAKGFLATFDEINQISKELEDTDIDINDLIGGGEAGGPDFSGIENIDMSWLVELGDKLKGILDPFEKGYAIGEAIAKQLNTLFDDIDWEGIKKKAEDNANLIAGFLSGGFETFDWKGLGETIGEGITTALIWLDTILANTNWAALGVGLGEGLNGVVKKIDWELLGKTFADGFNALLAIAYNFLTTFNWGEFARSIANGLNSAFKNTDWALLGQTLGEVVNTIFTLLYEFATTFKWSEAGADLAVVINNWFKTIKWDVVGKGISELVKGILDLLISFIKDTDWEEVGNSIGTMLANIDYEGVANKVGEALGNLVGAILKLFIGLLKGMYKEDIEKAGGNIILGVIGGVLNALVEAPKLLAGAVDKFFSSFLKMFGIEGQASEIMRKIGTYITKGLIFGILGPLQPLTETIKTIYDYIVPKTMELFGIHSPSTVMEEIGNNIMQGLLDGLMSFFEKIGEFVVNLTEMFVGMLEWFTLDFVTGINEAIDALVGFVSEGIDNIITFIEPFTDFLSELLDFIFGEFSEKWEEAWGNIGTVFTDIWKGLVGGLFGFINMIIDGINGLISSIVSGLNAMVDAAIAAAKLVGITLPAISITGPQIPKLTVPTFEVPKLATGAVIPPNKEFYALLGDQKHGTNLEAPEDLIRQIVREESGGGDNSSLVPLLQELISAVKSQSFKIGKETIYLANQEAARERGFAQEGMVAFPV